MSTFLPGLFLNAIMDAVDIFLLACGKPQIILYMQLSILPVHFMGDLIFIKYMDYGVKGAAMACNVTSFISCTCLITYISRCPDFAEAWYRPTMQTFKGMGEYLALAIPGTVMMFVEALSLQSLVLMASTLKDVDSLAALALVVSIAELFLMIPYGTALSASTFVGNAMGANKPERAK